ncbi:hypothetical protein KUTeg_007231, partial [Tegillarca granosa]
KIFGVVDNTTSCIDDVVDQRPSPGQVGVILQAPRASTSTMPDVVWCADDDITAQLREEIWGHQYVNLSLLLKGSAELTDFYTASNLVLNESGCFEFRPKVLKDKIPSIEKLTDAFLLFTNIYLRRYPERAVELTQYMSVIRDAAARSSGFGWRAYDEKFCLRQPIQYQSWATLNYPLWLRLPSVPRNSDKVGSGGNVNKNKGVLIRVNAIGQTVTSCIVACSAEEITEKVYAPSPFDFKEQVPLLNKPVFSLAKTPINIH